MRCHTIIACFTGLFLVGGLTTLAWTQGQPATPKAPPTLERDETKGQARDLSKWPFVTRQIYFSGQRGSEWLQRANGLDGRFAPGYVPALAVPLENNQYIHQIGATLALAKSAKYYRNEKAAAKASQALLTLLLDTALEDPANPSVRLVTLPAGAANRLGVAALLVRAIHELPQPGADLLEQAEQLCNMMRRLQRTDGMLACSDSGLGGKAGVEDAESIHHYSGEALIALMVSQRGRPASWKLEAVQAALPHYLARWRTLKNMTMVPHHSAAYAEAYLQTGNKALADAVFEMNDWLCTLQYAHLDPQHPLWVGGFMGFADGKQVQIAPQATCAACSESLVHAARVAHKVGDLQRWERYKGGLERSMQFLLTLQYTEANTLHFSEAFRPLISGSFHASHQDGNIRLDYSSQAVSAMIDYLTYIVELP